MFWIFVWFVLSAILIGATVWSLQILLRQKKAWAAFAKKHNFAFQKGTFMGPAEMSGSIGEYKIGFFTAERMTLDVRGKRYVSVIEVQLLEGLIDGGVAGTKEMQAFMNTLAQLQPYPVNKQGWNPEHTIHVRDKAVADAYFTPERLDAFEQVLKTRGADVIIVFNHEEFVIRMETSDPMMDPAKIEKVVSRQMALANKMRITPQQRSEYMAKKVSA